MAWEVKNSKSYCEPPPPSKRFYQSVLSNSNMDIVVYSGDKDTTGKVISKDDLEVVAKYKPMNLVFDEEMTIKKQAFNELRVAYFETVESLQDSKGKIRAKDANISELSRRINQNEKQIKDLEKKNRDLEDKLNDALYRPTLRVIIADWLAAKLAKPKPILPPCGPYR